MFSHRPDIPGQKSGAMATASRRIGIPMVGEPLEPRRLLAAAPVLAADINTIGVGGGIGDPVVFNNALYFGGPNGELWRYDGTTPVQVTHISPRPDDAASRAAVADLEVFNGALYFRALHPDTGEELWRYDGTTASLAADVSPGYDPDSRRGSSEPEELTAAGNALYFTAKTEAFGREVWKFDGTTASMLGDINPGRFDSRPHTAPYGLTAHEGSVYFSAWSINGGGPAELWRYDGATLSNLNRTAGGADVVVFTREVNAKFASLGGSLYFPAAPIEGSWNQFELYRYDPAANAIFLAADVRPGPASSDPAGLFTFGDAVYFAAHGDDATGRELWKVTSAGVASLAADLVPGPQHSTYHLTGYSLAEFAGDLYGSVNFDRLFRYDGTAASVIPGTDDVYGPMVAYGDALYFASFSRDAGRELTKYDGRTVSLVFDGFPGTAASYPGPMEAVGDLLYLFADADFIGHPDLHTFDGAAARLADDRGGAGFVGARDIAPLGGKVYFNAVNVGDDGTELWRYDGGAAGGSSTRVLGDPQGFRLPYDAELFPYDGALYFFASRDVAYDPYEPDPGNPGDDHGQGLWRFDGTRAQLVVPDVVQPAEEWPRGGAPGFAAYDGALYFAAAAPPGGDVPSSLWKYDGTTATRIPGTGAGAFEPASDLMVVGDTLYFPGKTPSQGVELLKYDGTTVSVAADVLPGSGSGSPTDLTTYRGALHFVADDGQGKGALFRYDGSTGAAARVTDGFGYRPVEPTEFDGSLYFWAAPDMRTPRRLYAYDGTSTRQVGDLRGDGPFVRFRNALYFSADDGLHGYELWKIPAEGPAPVATVAGRHVFYNNSAYDGGSPAADARDDGAVAPDKRALLP
ncbi:MAG TPA: hypothetical protein VFB66_22625, partial [Tepidisphaeraceae bacterium]|nr:hypothetical protein [Tepidisphaeraceae bacterium]